jgi:hypothetical protein
MNFRRGFFRLWLVFSILFVIGTAAVFYRDVRSEFEKAAVIANSILMVPVACNDARGKAGIDYEVFDDPSKTNKCWYQVPKLRALFPEYIEKLVAIWPKAFFTNQSARKPLKLGIHRDMAGQSHGFSSAELRRAVGQYCRSPGYLAACTEGAERIDLNGLVIGSVSAEAVGAAVKIARLSGT